MNREAWHNEVHGIAKSQTQLSELITAHSTVVKNPPASAGDVRNKGLFPGLGRSPGEGNGNPLQRSCLENSTDRGAWQAVVHGISNLACTHTF